jgi:hypothetical protein
VRVSFVTSEKSGFILICCTIVSNRQDACSTKDKFSCGTGKMPVHKRLIDNGATYEFIPLISNAKFICCGTGILPVLEKCVTYEF